MYVFCLRPPFTPHKGGRKSSLESPIHLKHNGTPQRFSSHFPVCPTHLPPQGRMEGQGVPCPAGPAATQLPSATETHPPPPPIIHPSIHPPLSLQPQLVLLNSLVILRCAKIREFESQGQNKMNFVITISKEKN